VKKQHNTLLIGAAVVGGLLLACVVVFSGMLERATREGGREVTATFRTTARLAKGSPVRVRGVDAGRVSDLTYDAQRHLAVAKLTVFDDVGPVYANARAEVRWRTVLGGNYAINLDPGTPASGALPGGVIDERHTGSQVEVDELLTALQRDPRTGLKTLLTEVPPALRDRDGLANALDALGDTAPKLETALSAVRGQQDADLRRLIRSTSATVAGLDTTRRTVRDVVEGGAATFATTGGRAAEIQASLDRLGADQPAIRRTLRALRGTLAQTDPLISSLDRAAPAVAPTVAGLRPLLRDTDTVLSRAQPLVRSLRPATRALATAARVGTPVLDELLPILDRVNATILPDLAKKDQVTGRSTYAMIGPTLSSVTAAASMFDSVSHIVTLSGGGGERSLDTLPCSTYFTDPTAAQLATCEDIGGYLARLLGGGPRRKR